MSTVIVLMIGVAAVCLAPPAALSAHSLTPAERAIANARRAMESNSENFESHNALALALARRARETADPSYYDQAEQELAESFRLKPDNFEGQKTRAWILLGKHDFGAALKVATEVNRIMPDDVLTYGLMADAHAELGDYEEAEKAVQWMLDLRAGNIAGLTRAAYLRELFGDPEGAIELMQSAYGRTPQLEVEDRAWMLVQVAHLETSRGRLERADGLLVEALKLFPDYHYALAELAKVRSAQKRYTEAADLLRKRYVAAPHPENLYDLAKALEHAGRTREAKPLWKQFEQRALEEMKNADNCNRELVLYYIEQARKPAEALRVAETEFARRKDVFTLDAYAWALHANGKHAEARQQIEKALAVGIRNPQILYHAGMIALKLGDRAAARGYFQKCLEPSGQPEYVQLATKALGRVER